MRLVRLKTDMNTFCNGIVIHQQLETGFLGGPKQICFDTSIDGIAFSIEVSQGGIRTVKVLSAKLNPLRKYMYIFNSMDFLLMLFDGEFIPIKYGSAVIDGVETATPELDELIGNRLSLFRSADYTRGNHSSFLDFESVLSDTLLQKWLRISSELDILHKMVLYSMADTGLPIDFKCAFLIESFEALAELINLYNKEYKIPINKRHESKLGKRLISVLDFYGTDIFEKEIAYNKAGFVSVLVNSRNRIAHIKSRQEEIVLDGPESVLYAAKLSYLYRRVLLSLLGIDYSCYSDKLKVSVMRWNAWNKTLEGFLSKIQTFQ